MADSRDEIRDMAGAAEAAARPSAGPVECERRDWLLFSCWFEPRYDEGPVGDHHLEDVRARRIADVFDAMKPRTYVRDVCVRCGATVER